MGRGPVLRTDWDDGCPEESSPGPYQDRNQPPHSHHIIARPSSMSICPKILHHSTFLDYTISINFDIDNIKDDVVLFLYRKCRIQLFKTLHAYNIMNRK